MVIFCAPEGVVGGSRTPLPWKSRWGVSDPPTTWDIFLFVRIPATTGAIFFFGTFPGEGVGGLQPQIQKKQAGTFFEKAGTHYPPPGGRFP